MEQDECQSSRRGNYEYDGGVLKLKYVEKDGAYSGARQQLDYENQSSHTGGHLHHEPLFGFWEARIQVDAIRNGRSCYFYLIPDGYDLNPDDSTTDSTAQKGAKIELLNQSVWGDNAYNVGIR